MESNNNEFKIVCTCDACPEQYDIYYNDKLTAYVRLRWGHLTVSPYDGDKISDYLIYEKFYHDDFKGCFANDIERETELDMILKNVKLYLDGKNALDDIRDIVLGGEDNE